jgi:hypothetical protein
MVPVVQEDGPARHFRYSQQFYGCVQHAGWQSNPRHSSSTLQTGYIFYRLSIPKMRHCQQLKWLQECLSGDYIKFSLGSTVIVRTPAIYGICVCEIREVFISGSTNSGMPTGAATQRSSQQVDLLTAAAGHCTRLDM